ncbi:MAG: hypothetical protein LBP22_08950 [Deltaproteobacteria bacterium]|jgi:hypothetical protein|nr:hypothetical protein [Deltaproteobacteria bacterium]
MADHSNINPASMLRSRTRVLLKAVGLFLADQEMPYPARLIRAEITEQAGKFIIFNRRISRSSQTDGGFSFGVNMDALRAAVNKPEESLTQAAGDLTDSPSASMASSFGGWEPADNE